jgi:hypothetical protein
MSEKPIALLREAAGVIDTIDTDTHTSSGVRCARLVQRQIDAAVREFYAAPPAPSAESYPLPDDMYGSKDWLAGNYAERVHWLHTMYENTKSQLDTYLSIQSAPSADPSELVQAAKDAVSALRRASSELRGLTPTQDIDEAVDALRRELDASET